MSETLARGLRRAYTNPDSVAANPGVTVKLTQWEFESLIEALEDRIEGAAREGRGTKNLERLRSKVVAHAEMTGKRRAKA